MNFGLSSKFPISLGFEKVEEVVISELKEVGFGILTEIDVKETMKKKLDLDYQPYKILGACNPEFANKVLEHDPEIGLLLPCNAIIYEREDNIIVSFVQPLAMFSMIESDNIKPIAEKVGTLLSDALDKIKERLSE